MLDYQGKIAGMDVKTDRSCDDNDQHLIIEHLKVATEKYLALCQCISQLDLCHCCCFVPSIHFFC